jgi:hypothetical protein
MIAAAITLWAMFSLWLIAPLVGMPRVAARIAIVLSALELLALLAWSYGTEGCNSPACAPLARAAGIAARADLPALAGAFLVALILQHRRRGLRSCEPCPQARAASRSATTSGAAGPRSGRADRVKRSARRAWPM